MNELIFKIIPVTAPTINIGFKPPIISGIAEIKHKYDVNLYYWNGKSYINEMEYMTENKYYSDDVYANIDDLVELVIYDTITEINPENMDTIVKMYKENYELCIAPAL